MKGVMKMYSDSNEFIMSKEIDVHDYLERKSVEDMTPIEKMIYDKINGNTETKMGAVEQILAEKYPDLLIKEV